MKVSCPSCQTSYNIEDKRIPPGGAKLKCAKCQTTFMAGGAVPLPGAAFAPPPPNKTIAFGMGSVPLPGKAASLGAVPLPGKAENPSAVPLPGKIGPPGGDFAIPLPGSAGPAAADLMDFSVDPPPPPEDVDFDPFGPPPPAESAPGGAFGAAPLDDLGFEDAALMDAPAEPPQVTPEADPLSFSFDDPPLSAASESAPDFDLNAELPTASPPTAPPPDLDFDPPPAAEAAADPLFDFSAPPEVPPNADPADFGDLDLGQPAQEASADFDLAAPLGAGAAAAPSEDVSFAEAEATPDAPPAEASGEPGRFHVKRKTGKVFGPFTEATLLKMLDEGQLAGDEDISPDRIEWSALASHAPFSEAAARAREGGGTHTAPAAEAAPRSPTAHAPPSMERLRQIYEGRMAAVAVVDGGGLRSIDWRKWLLPGLGALAALIVFGAGGSLAFTRYGAFGLKALFPSKISSGSVAANQLVEARQSLLVDTFQSYQSAKKLTDGILRTKEYPEVRAVWSQAVYYLYRRYAAATASEVKAADRSLPNIQLLGEKNPDVVKSYVGSALAAHNPDLALAGVQEAWNRAVAKGDPDIELGFLLSEALLAKGQNRAAADVLKRALTLRKNSAKALHALGNMHQAAGEADAAEKAYQDALVAEPRHVNSAVELAAVEILLRKDFAKGIAAVDQALDEKVKAGLGPAEVARARALRGAAYLLTYEPAKAIPELQEALKVDHESTFARANLGRAYLLQRQYQEALPLYREATTREPQNLDYTEGYLQTLVALGRMNDALTAVTQANTRFPGNAHIAFLFGRVDEALDHNADAEGHYKRAIQGDAKLTEASLALARFYVRSRRIPDAKTVLEEELKRAPEDPAVHSAVGELLLAQDDVEKAKVEFDRAIAAAPNQAEAHLGESRVAYAHGDFAAAKQEVDKAIELDAHVKEGHLQLGTVLFKLADFVSSAKELELAKAEDPSNPRVSIALGAVRLAQNDLVGAETNLVSALSAEPANPEANFYLARVKDRRALYTQALEVMKSALDRAPKRADFHYEMGLIYRDAKQLNDAIEEWKITVNLAPNAADAYEAMGQAYLEQGKFENSLASFRSALKADPARARVFTLMGDCYFQQAKWPEAIKNYQEALKMDPKLTNAYYKIGRAWSEEGQHDKAISWYVKATELDKGNPMPFYFMGFAHKERGRKKEAIEAFQTYLKLRPDADDKKEINDEIYDLQKW